MSSRNEHFLPPPSAASETDGFPVDNCFSAGVGRRPIDVLTMDGGADGGRPADEITFEEFIRGKQRGQKAPNVVGEGMELRAIDEDDRQSDHFFDITLDTARVPEDPRTTYQQNNGPPPARRSDIYAIGSGQQQQQGSRQSFRHSFCPSVGDSGDRRRGSVDSDVYGYEPPSEEPVTAKTSSVVAAATDPNSSARRANSSSLKCRGSEIGHSLRKPPARDESAYPNLSVSRFLCCFRTLESSFPHKQQIFDKYLQPTGGTIESGGNGSAQKGGYSWDRPAADGRLDPSQLVWTGLHGETRVKQPGQLAGHPFQVENCTGSLLVILDHCASLTVDDCQDCVILCGPCQGSIFLRDCANILVLAICQQFRTRDCRQLTAHLFCATFPTIEETDIAVGPLQLNYAGLQAQMHQAGLSPFVSRWSQVHNFTPETGKCRFLHGCGRPTADNLWDPALVYRLNNFLTADAMAIQFQLTLGNLRDSALFMVEAPKSNRRDGQQDRALVLIQPRDGVDPCGLPFYTAVVDLAQSLLKLSDNVDNDGHDCVRLVSMHDVDLRPGEWKAVVQQQQAKKNAACHKEPAKVIVLELAGPGAIRNAELTCQKGSSGFALVQLTHGDRMEQLRKQLYRLCEIRQST